MGNSLTTPTKTLTVPAGQLNSNAVEVEDFTVYSLRIPTLVTPTKIKIQGSVDTNPSTATFQAIQDEFANPVLDFTNGAAGTGNALLGSNSLRHIQGFNFIRVVIADTQAADAVFTLYMRSGRG